MNQATTLITAAISKMVSLILTAGVLVLVAGAAGFALAKLNPQWSRATKRAVHSGLVFAAAALWVVIFLARMRAGA